MKQFLICISMLFCLSTFAYAGNDSKVAYVGGGEITLGQYVSDDANPLTVAGNGHIKTPQWIIHSAS